jgi:hypothetical protein
MLPERPRFSSSSVRRRRLIIIEKNAPNVTCRGDERFEEAVVISQLPDEEPAELAQRAVHRIGLAERTGRPFHEAFFCTSATDSSATRAARRLITLGVAVHADAVHCLDELVLCASSDVDFAERQSLVQLADDTVLAGREKPLRVRLCFVDDEPEAAPQLHSSSRYGWLPDLPEDRVA